MKRMVTDTIYLEFIDELDSPKEIFDMVMEYARITVRSEWECFGEAFSPMRHTLIISEDPPNLYRDDDEHKKYIGYANIYITTDNDIFFHHGYLVTSQPEGLKIMDAMCHAVQSRTDVELKDVILHSGAKSDLWCRKYDFLVSDEKIYVKAFPKKED